MSTVKNSLTSSPLKNIESLVAASKNRFTEVMPKHMDIERFTRICLGEIKKNPKLLECDQMSLMGAMMTMSQLGVEPGVLGQAYLIPYGKECQFQLSYKGMIELLRRTGQLKDIYAYAVYENDEFSIEYGLSRNLIHKPLLKGNRGEVIAYYAVAILKDGTVAFDDMTKADVEAHAKKFSVAYAKGWNSPWKTDFDEMAKKTVIKKMLKYLPVSVEYLEKVEMEDKKYIFSDVKGENIEIEVTPEVEKAPEVIEKKENETIDIL